MKKKDLRKQRKTAIKLFKEKRELELRAMKNKTLPKFHLPIEGNSYSIDVSSAVLNGYIIEDPSNRRTYTIDGDGNPVVTS